MPTLILDTNLTVGDSGGGFTGFYTGTYGSVSAQTGPTGISVTEFDTPDDIEYFIGLNDVPDAGTGDFSDYLHSIVIDGVEFLLTSSDYSASYLGPVAPFGEGVSFAVFKPLGLTSIGSTHSVKVYRK